MVDNLRFSVQLKEKYDFDFLEKHKNVQGFIKHIFPTATTFRLYLFKDDVSDIDNYKVRSIPSLEIGIVLSELNSRIVIENSLRKWYYGKNSMKDFNLNDFINCLDLISQLLKINFIEILNAKIFYLEIGANLKFRSEDKTILLSIFDHEDLKGISSLNNNQTIRLEGVNRKISIYDKLQEMFDKNNFSKKILEKLSDRYFFGRCEIKIEKVSGVQFSKLKTGTLGDLILNWNEVAEYWEKEMFKIKFVEFLSPPVMLALITKKIPLDNFINYLGMKEMNASQFKFLLDEFYNKNYSQKAKVRKRLTQNTMMFDSLKGSQTIPNFNKLVSKKARYFKGSSNKGNI
ncbi:hypothetical protein FLAN108750_04625 [Flavobacterium antarcticum]|uniref:hypothetical protein n=1 Tax=Flavobacterium antarcticum TaxID=271155 RepID=UPI0003B3BBD5|nr:hypothetical protein [Flavobacterium antarcticum]